MKEPDIEGVAIHDGPESCAAVRKARGEALTGVHVGRPLSREISAWERRRGYVTRKAIWNGVLSRVPFQLPAVGDTEHAWNLHAREPGDPRSTRCNSTAGHIGKA